MPPCSGSMPTSLGSSPRSSGPSCAAIACMLCHIDARRSVSFVSIGAMSAYTSRKTRPPDLLMIQTECTPGGFSGSSGSVAGVGGADMRR